jgi:hypothetical protein
MMAAIGGRDFDGVSKEAGGQSRLVHGSLFGETESLARISSARLLNHL